MTGPDLERLLAEDAWLRRLARSLAGDAATAEDLVQETWAAALAADEAPREGRAWLAGTLRNLRRRFARGDGRRAARERDAARGGHALPTDEVVSELVLRREVVDALLALDEPDRGVLFRRFFKDASLESIAREDGVAVSTVHARLERGLERMRARFDAARGGRRAWLVGLLRAADLAPAGGVDGPLPGGWSGAAVPQATLLGGALAMTTAIKAVAAVAAVVLVGWWWQGRGATAPAAAAPGPEAAVLEERDAPLTPADGEREAGAQVAAAPASGHRAPAPVDPEVPALAPAPARIHRGRLVDLAGAPLAGVPVRLLASPAPVPRIATADVHGTGFGAAHAAGGAGHGAHAGPGPAGGARSGSSAEAQDGGGAEAPAGTERLGSGVTGGDGAFAIELPADVADRAPVPGRPHPSRPRGYALDDPRLVLVVATVDATGAPLLLAAPRATFAGTVFDPHGAPFSDVEVQLVVRETLFRSLGLMYAINLELPAWSTRTDEQGRFRFDDAVGGEHASLYVPWGLYQGAALTPPAHDDLALELRLGLREDVLLVAGLVLDAAGAPVAGAAVSVGADIDESDADGRFELAWDTNHGSAYADAVARGMHPRPTPQSHAAAYAPGLGVARVELTRELVRQPVVLRLSGAPLALSGRVVDATGQPIADAQVWMTDPTHFGSRRETFGEGFVMHATSLEELMVGKRSAVADAAGRFLLEGLIDRAYALQAFDARTCTFGPGWTIRAGSTEVELVVETDPSARRVAGRLVSRGGKPLAGVDVRPVRTADRSELEWPPLQFRLGTTTDADGRFEFPELAVDGTQLTIFGGHQYGYLVEYFELTDFGDLERIEIVLPLPCELQIVLLDPDSADLARVLDADGNALQILEHHGTWTMMPETVRIVAGRSAVVSVGEVAHEVVLEKDGEEVARLPLRVDPERMTTVEF